MNNKSADKAKETFSRNLNRLMDLNGVTQNDIVQRFKITASTVSDWCKGKKYPRIDKYRGCWPY